LNSPSGNPTASAVGGGQGTASAIASGRDEVELAQIFADHLVE
jgi:hypothetical protein